MDNLQLKSDPIPAVPAVPGATPAWMTLVTSLVASGAQIAAAVAQAITLFRNKVHTEP